MLDPSLGGSLAPVKTRVDDDPSTKSACGGGVCSDAPICLSSFSEKEVPTRENIQWRKGKERVHYLLKEDKGGAKSSDEAHRTPGDRPQKKKTRRKILKSSVMIQDRKNRSGEKVARDRRRNMKTRSWRT